MKNSQIIKTNGFYALIKLLNFVLENALDYSNLSKLRGNIDWNNIEGTGKKAQNILAKKVIDVIKN